MSNGSFSVFTAFKARDGVSPVFKNMSQNSSNFKNKISGLSSTVQVLGKALKYSATICTAVYAAFSGFAVLSTKTTLNYAKEVKKMQRLTGANVQDASRMTAAGQRFGVSSDGMAKALRKLTITAQSGSKEFRAYGLKVKDTHGKLLSAPRLLEVVADKYKKLGGGLLGAAFAQKVMGRSSMEMIPILEKGSGGIRAMYEESERMGLVLTNETMKAFGKFAQAQKDIKQASTGIQVIIGSKVLPYFAQMAERAELFIKNFDFRQVGVSIDSVFKGIDGAIKALNPVFDKLGESFKYLNGHLIPELVGLSPVLKMFFEGVLVPALVFSVNSWNNLFIVIDKTYNFIKSNFVPIISVLAGVLSGLALYKTVQFFQALRVQMALASMQGGILGSLAKGEIAIALKSLGVAIWGSVKAIWAQNAALLSNPLFWIPAAIGAVVAGIVLLWKNWDFLTAVIGNWSNKATSWLSIFWIKVQEVFGAVGGYIKAHFTNALLSALGPIGWVILGLKNIGGTLGNIKGIQLPGFNHKNNVQSKTPISPKLVNNKLTSKKSNPSGIIEVRNIVENKNNSRISSGVNLLLSHSLNLKPSF